MKTFVNWLCFTICILCIITGTTISILAIWHVVADQAFLWRSLMTLAVVFLAALLAFMVNSMMTSGGSD